MKDYDFRPKKTQVIGIANVPGLTNVTIVANTDRQLWVANYPQAMQSQEHSTEFNISQVQVLSSARGFFAGVGEAGQPGSIQVWKFPAMQKISAAQAHSAPISRMRLTYHNDWLFTAGKDACLYVHEVKDKLD